MDTWQEWVAIIVSFVITTLGWQMRAEKQRTDKFRDDTQDKIAELSERITRVEAEIVTEREVREILHDLVSPLTVAILKIEGKTEDIASDITEIKVAIARIGQDA